MTVKIRIRVLLVFFLIFLSLVILRLIYWQIIKHEELAIEADAQHFSSVSLSALRGEILDKEEEVLVGNRPSFEIYLNKKRLSTSIENVINKLVPLVLNNDSNTASTEGQIIILKQDLLKKSETDANWVRLFTNISNKVKQYIEAEKIEGISFNPVNKRIYYEASMSAHLLGFVAEDTKGERGFFGVEGYYQRELIGKNGRLLEERDAFDRPILIGEQDRIEAIDGSDIVLTLDRSVQKIVETNLKAGVETWGAKGGTVVVIDPKTGAILASASVPSFDPSHLSSYPESHFKDPVVSDLYEPGSIMKPLVLAAAINENKLTPLTRCSDCSGPVTIGEYKIHTFNNEYHPQTTMSDVLVNSDNTGMVYVGNVLGFEKLYEYINNYGFGQKTGVDLEGETNVSLKKTSQFYPIDQATLTFGQGIAVTSIQMIRAFAAIANGGELVKPHIVQKILSAKGEKKILFGEKKRVLNTLTTQLVTEMLVKVTNESPLRFPRDRIEGLKKFKIAAKSGTAQIPIAGQYTTDRIIGSVIGFAPASNPKFLILVKLDSPSVRQWGSDTAGPIFFQIANELLAYYNVAPED